MSRAVLFDVFGTLLYLSVKRRPFLTLMQDLPLDRAKLLEARERLMTTTLPTIREAAVALAEMTGAAPSETAIEAAEGELAEHLESCQVVEGALSLLAALRHDGYGLALVSNLASVYVPVIERLGLPELVDLAAYSCEFGRTKPDSAIFSSALQHLGVEAPQATMVGNSLRSDVLGAKQAGLNAVWLTESVDTEHVCVASLAALRGVLL